LPFSDLFSDFFHLFTFYSHSKDVLRNSSSLIERYRSFFSSMLEKEDLSNYEIIGISVSMECQIIPAVILVEEIRKHTDASICFGGAIFGLMCDQDKKDLFELARIDYICEFEGERFLLRLVDYLSGRIKSIDEIPNLCYFSEGELIRSKAMSEPINLNSDDRPSFAYKSFTDPSVASVTATQSRGCYWNKCTFCDYVSLHGKNLLRVKRPDVLVEEITETVSKTGISKVQIINECMSPSYAKEFSSLINRKNLKIQWSTFIRIERGFTKELLSLMEKSGCSKVVIGLESLNDVALMTMCKGYSMNDAMVFFSNAAGSNILFECNIILDVPPITKNDAIAQLNNLASLVTNVNVRYSWFEFVLTRTSVMAKNPGKYAITIKDSSLSNESDKRMLINSLDFSFPGRMSEVEVGELGAYYSKLNEKSKAMKRYGAILNDIEVEISKFDYSRFFVNRDNAGVNHVADIVLNDQHIRYAYFGATRKAVFLKEEYLGYFISLLSGDLNASLAELMVFYNLCADNSFAKFITLLFYNDVLIYK